MVISADEHKMHAKLGAKGVYCVKTAKAVIIGTYESGTSPQEVSVVIEGIADHLIGSGF